MNWHRFRKPLLLVVATGLAALVGVAWIVGGALVAPAHCVVGPPPADFQASAVTFPSESGATLAAWHLPVSSSNATAILLHPIRGDRRSMISRGKLFHQHGYSTLLVDLQAHGESIGKNITIGHLERLDVLAAIEFVRKRDADQKIVLVGSSLGGASVLFAEPEVDVVVLESVYPAVTEAVHNRVQMWLGPLHHAVAPVLLMQLRPRLGISADELRPIDRIDKLGCPVLIASGDCDRHTTIEETRRLFDAAREPKRMVVFEGAGHVDLLGYDPAKYESEVMLYVNQAIGDREQAAEVQLGSP